jgi:hypothetical protein
MGVCKAIIRSHSLGAINDKLVVRIQVDTDHGDDTELLVWVTDKSYGIARAQLKVCGFDSDKTPLGELDKNPELLAGTEIPILVEPYNGKLRPSILLNPKPTDAAITKAQAGLRQVKKGNADTDDDLPF